MTATTPRKKSAKTPKKKGGWTKTQASPVDLPSGETALLKRPGMAAFLKKGSIPDSLAPIIQAQIDKAQGKPGKPGGAAELDVAALMQDPEKLGGILELLDIVLVECVVEPKVEAAPEDPAERRDDVFYPDEVDLEDKMFIFNYAVGGTRDLERFRAGTTEALASVADVAGVQVAP